MDPKSMHLQDYHSREAVLIKSDSKEWDNNFIKQTFMPQDVDAILSIPLSARGAQDRVV